MTIFLPPTSFPFELNFIFKLERSLDAKYSMTAVKSLWFLFLFEPISSQTRKLMISSPFCEIEIEIFILNHNRWKYLFIF